MNTQKSAKASEAKLACQSGKGNRKGTKGKPERETSCQQCTPFFRGNCKKGDQCNYEHQVDADGNPTPLGPEFLHRCDEARLSSDLPTREEPQDIPPKKFGFPRFRWTDRAFLPPPLHVDNPLTRQLGFGGPQKKSPQNTPEKPKSAPESLKMEVWGGSIFLRRQAQV